MKLSIGNSLDMFSQIEMLLKRILSDLRFSFMIDLVIYCILNSFSYKKEKVQRHLFPTNPVQGKRDKV